MVEDLFSDLLLP